MFRSRIILVGLLIAGGFWLAQKQLASGQIHVAYTPADSGKKMFKAYCASCHGVSSTGNGPIAATVKAKAHGPYSIGQA